MAELRFEAPLASFEDEEWDEHCELRKDFIDGIDDENNISSEPTQQPPQNSKEVENFRETCSASLEDLVNSFDERISNSFCNFEEQVEEIAPVQIRSQEEIVNDCQMWWTITGNYGNILPIDWSKTSTHMPQSKEQEDPFLYLSDDDDFNRAFDMHSIIVASLHHEDEDKVESAEDVIRQIEDILQDPSTEKSDEEKPVMTEDDRYSQLKAQVAKLSVHTEAELKTMTSGQLQELMGQLEQSLKQLSEMMMTEDALRDELDYDKDLKNSFISLLLSNQKKRRDSSADRKKKKHRNSHGQVVVDPACPTPEVDSSALTTVVPYYPEDGPPTSEQLQIYIKILEAINENSSTLPTLLTDYILKVLCPAH